MFGLFSPNPSAVLLSHIKSVPTMNHQPVSGILSRNKSTLYIINQPAEQAV
jgi:hypothetical protein